MDSQTVFDVYAGEQAALADWLNRHGGHRWEVAFPPPRPDTASRGGAEEWLGDMVRRGEVRPGTAVAVQFDGEVMLPPASLARDEAACQKAREKLHAAQDRALAALKGAKSATVGCKGCSSKVARRFLESASCPVCKVASLAPAGTAGRLDQLTAAVAEWEETLRAARGRPAVKKAGRFWLVCRVVPEFDGAV